MGFIMKKNNIIILMIVFLVMILVFGYAMWATNKLVDENNMEDIEANVEENKVDGNIIEQNTINEYKLIENNTDYVGEWFINEEAYLHSERIDSIMDRKEEHLISNEDFESQMNAESNSNIVELDVDEYFQNKIKFDFILTSPAPTQREGKLDDIVVEVINGVGKFTYTDNWGTSGNGTITLGENKIELRLETTKAAQGALWGVEGVYTFSYKKID